MRSRVRFGFAAIVALMLATCAPGTSSAATPLGSRILTPDQGDSYSVSLSGDVITMKAPATNVGTNLREVFWPASASTTLDGRVCATWSSQSADSVQEGVAFHIVAGATSTRAITVTKNIVYGVFWVMNVHVWDSSLAQPFTQIAQFDASKVVTTNAAFVPFPWRVCSRMTGATLQFKIWVPANESEPSWSDTTHVGTTTVPADYLTPGKTGWYVGHIPPSGSAQYKNLSIS